MSRAAPYDHVAPGQVPPARSGRTERRVRLHVRSLRLPSPPRSLSRRGSSRVQVYNEEYQAHVTHRDVAEGLESRQGFHATRRRARTFDHLFTRDVARDPNEWATFAPRAVPEWMMDPEVVDKSLSELGKDYGTRPHPKGQGVERQTPTQQLDDPKVELTEKLIVEVLKDVSWHFFPRLAPAGETH